MSDLITSLRMSLMINKEPKVLISNLPYPELFQELRDYVNSEEYQKLIIKEKLQISLLK